MNRFHIAAISFILSLLCHFNADAQIISEDLTKILADSIKHEMEFYPYFGLYKDNYFCVGTEPFKKPTSTNSNVKFQISLAIRLTDRTLPLGTYLFLTYTQKTFSERIPKLNAHARHEFQPGHRPCQTFFQQRPLRREGDPYART